MRVLKALTRWLTALFRLTLAVSLVSAAAAALMRPRLPDRSQPEDDELDLVTIYGSRQLRSTSAAFRGGRLVCWYAGADLDLRGARLDAAGGDLTAWTVFGGTRIRVPEEWRVELHGVAVLGGAGSAAPRPEPEFDGPVLRVRHRTIFGGFAVVAEPDDELLAV